MATGNVRMNPIRATSVDEFVKLSMKECLPCQQDPFRVLSDFPLLFARVCLCATQIRIEDPNGCFCFEALVHLVRISNQSHTETPDAE